MNTQEAWWEGWKPYSSIKLSNPSFFIIKNLTLKIYDNTWNEKTQQGGNQDSDTPQHTW